MGMSRDVVISMSRDLARVDLSAEAQRELVDRHAAGAAKKALARAYGVHVETVRAIIAQPAALADAGRVAPGGSAG